MSGQRLARREKKKKKPRQTSTSACSSTALNFLKVLQTTQLCWVYSKPTVNTHTQRLCQALNRELFPLPLLLSLSSPHLFLGWGRVRSQRGLRAGTSLSAEAGLAPAATEGLRLNALALSLLNPDADDFAFSRRTIIPLCSARAESQLCPVNLNLWHTYSGRTYCCVCTRATKA